ncbi:kinase-like protein [Xylariaceae sp. FL0016]|nr:kinase-like protein [Xylariaceae sp. FL0016]
MPATCACDGCPHRKCRIDASRDQIAKDLLSVSEKDLNDDRHRFIPKGELCRILTHARVRKHLETISDDEKLLRKISKAVSPAESDFCHCNESQCTGYRIIFVALVQIAQEEVLFQVFESNDTKLCDRYWPRTLGGLSPKDSAIFAHAQLQFRSPYITKLQQHEVSFMDIDQSVVLPWTELEELQPELAHRSFVQKIKIHPDHYDFGNDGDEFALKVFEERPVAGLTGDDFLREIRCNQQTPIHGHIVPLLAAFRHRHRYYLVFPWARGGSLQTFFESRSPTEKTETGQIRWTMKWIMTQCLGLAQGLAATHQGSNGIDDQNSAQTKRQLHEDIKPENILCFETKQNGKSSMTLKLADFGLARKLEADLTLAARKDAHTKTYRPPEHDTEDRISPKFDVWCLGCLYLDFITWKLGGWSKVIDFGKDRLQDDGRQVLEDTFFEKVTKRPFWFDLSKARLKIDAVTKSKSKKERVNWWSLWIGHCGTMVNSKVKQTVTSHIEYLMGHQECTDAIRAFLDFIRTRMLVVDPQERVDATVLRDFMHHVIEMMEEMEG